MTGADGVRRRGQERADLRAALGDGGLDGGEVACVRRQIGQLAALDLLELDARLAAGAAERSVAVLLAGLDALDLELAQREIARVLRATRAPAPRGWSGGKGLKRRRGGFGNAGR